MLTQFKILLHALKRNGFLQLFFYLSNLDATRFIEYTKTVEYLDKEDTQFILDLGAGYSVLPSFLKRESSKGTYVTYDLSFSACKYQAEPKYANMCQILGDMKHLPIKSSSINAVIAISSIEHIPDDALVFKEIERIIKDDGVAIISLPYSFQGPKIARMVRSSFLLKLLHKLNKFWSLILGKHLNYFMEQTATDSIQKSYDDNEIADVLNNLSLEKRYLYGKKIFDAFFRYIPVGWLVLKDLFFGLVFSKLDDLFIKSNESATGIVFKVRKT